MKENEYDNGYIERQTVSSNPPELDEVSGILISSL